LKTAGAVRRSARRAKAPRQLGEALQQLAKDLGIAKPLRQYEVLTSWEEIVGEQISKVTKAERIEDGVLIVRVATAPWRAELTLRRSEILGKIVSRFGTSAVREIRFR